MARFTYGDEVGRLAVFQLDPQPVKVLVAPSHAVLWQVKLYPCCLKKHTHTSAFAVLPGKIQYFHYLIKAQFWVSIVEAKLKPNFPFTQVNIFLVSRFSHYIQTTAQKQPKVKNTIDSMSRYLISSDESLLTSEH